MTSTTINRRKAIILLAQAIGVGVVVSTTALSRSSLKPVPSDLVTAFKEAYVDLQSISLSFSSTNGNGTLEAIRGRGFRIVMPGREIVSDGKSVWHAQSQTKTVVVNSVSNTSEELSIERVFFALINVYTPSVTSNTASKKVIRLIPPSADARIAGVDEASVHVDSTMRITSIDIVSGHTTTAWNISALKRNPKLPLSLFAYKAPAGWKLIDLR